MTYIIQYLLLPFWEMTNNFPCPSPSNDLDRNNVSLQSDVESEVHPVAPAERVFGGTAWLLVQPPS